MRKGKLVYFHKNGEIHSGEVMGTLNEMIIVPYLADRKLYIHKDWVFKTKAEAEKKVSKYKLKA